MSIGAAALFEQRIEVKSWLSDFFLGGEYSVPERKELEQGHKMRWCLPACNC